MAAGGHQEAFPRELALELFSREKAAEFTVPFEALEDADRGLCAVLERYGCAVVTDVASTEDLGRLEELFSQDLRDLIDHKRLKGGLEAAEAVNAGSWPRGSMPVVGNIDRCQLRGLPHGRFAWACRLHPNVRRCYEVIHEGSALISSCDNSFFSPASAASQGSNKVWPHVDHNVHDTRTYDEDGVPMSDWDVYQGVLYIWPADGPGASTTVLQPGSHKESYELLMSDPQMQKRGAKGTHFSQLSYLSEKRLRAQLLERWQAESGRVPVPAGALLLWNSRTLHQGWSGGPRLAQPVCWEPAQRRDDLARDRKLRLAALGLPSTHWASLGLPHNLVAPRPCEPSAAVCSGKPDEVAFPSKGSISLASLREGQSQERLWDLLGPLDWEKPLPEQAREMILSALKPEILAAL